MSTIAERVAAGAAFLDEHDPDWWRADVERAIDLDTLELRIFDSCILGQRCPVTVLAAYLDVDIADVGEPDELTSVDWTQAYHAYAVHLHGVFRGTELAEWATVHGFNADMNAEFPDLTAEWKRVITERRSTS